MESNRGVNAARIRSMNLRAVTPPPTTASRRHRLSMSSSSVAAPASAAAPTSRRQQQDVPCSGMQQQQPPQPQPRARCAEVAGARIAESAAICCCIPCTVLDLVVLTAVKLPAGLCRKAARKRKEKDQKKIKKNKVDVGAHVPLTDDSSATSVATTKEGELPAACGAQSAASEKQQMEKEMWDKFYNTGFWRSPSQKESSTFA